MTKQPLWQSKMEIQKTFPERLQAVHAELVEIARSSELEYLIKKSNYKPGCTILDAIETVSELAQLYQLHYPQFRLPKDPK